jgi:hypothetical protein
MAERIERHFSFIFFIALCLLVAGLTGLSWKKDTRSGELGTTIVNREGLAYYDLDSGDSICYAYEASGPCWFTITTDPLNPEIGEKLNLSGTENSGRFRCPATERYVVQVYFLDVPEGELATVDYEIYALDDASRAMMIMKPVLLTVLTVVLASLVSINHRRTRTPHLGGGPDTTQSYWLYFASRIGNWIAIVAGASVLAAMSVIDSADLTSALSGSVRDWLITIGTGLLIYGLLFGLGISWQNFKAKTH